jgi:N6-adenosine-specific RNA methylase IME4
MTWEGLWPPYGTIVADPPWHYEKTNADKDAEDYEGRSGLGYGSMTLDEIKALPVGDLAADTRLFLWVTSRYLRHAWDVVEAWGFQPQDKHLVWCKQPRCTTPVTTEYVLIAKHGKPERMPWSGTTWYQWPLQPVHSQKPDAFMDLVEQWCPGPYVELFSRRPRFGWDSWGHGYEIGATA